MSEYTTNKISYSTPEKVITCYTCKETGHTARNCNVESKMSTQIKQEVGHYMETFISNNIKCPGCKSKNKTLYVLNNHSPSLDLKCNCCNINIEVKSKCLSIERLPEELEILHGAYNEFVNSINDLNMVIVIYRVDRPTQDITIREILYIPTTALNNKNNITYEKREGHLTTIYINDRLKFHNLLKSNNIQDADLVINTSTIITSFQPINDEPFKCFDADLDMVHKSTVIPKPRKFDSSSSSSDN